MTFITLLNLYEFVADGYQIADNDQIVDNDQIADNDWVADADDPLNIAFINDADD
jgi:hypothetical protein